MAVNDTDVAKIAAGLANSLYRTNLQATRELINLFDKLSGKPLNAAEDYIEMYEDNFFTYPTWDALVESEKEQTDGLTEEELRAEFEKEPGSIWRLPCGWYVQYV